MSVHQPSEQFAKAMNEAAPRRNRGEHAFDLPPAVHAITAGAYLTFAGVLCATFMGPDLVLPAAIFMVGIASLFVTPGLWARIQPRDGLRKQSWTEFLEEGVECLTGKLTAGQALAQILVLPGLIVSLAFVFAVIKATL